MAQEVREAKRNKRIRSQTRKVIMNVYNYFRHQDERESETDVDLRIAAATGISVRSFHSIKQQYRCGVIRSPPPRSRISPVLGSLDDLAKDSIRQEIFSFYEKGERPTVEALLMRVRKPPVSFSGAYSSLYKVVKQLGFRYRRVEGGGYILMERSDVSAARNKYLRLLDENRRSSSPRPEIYMDEMWLNETEFVVRDMGLTKKSAGRKGKTRKGARYFIVHAGGEDGFVQGALLFQSINGNKKDSDDINDTCFHSWFQTQLLPNIPPHSLIVMDNAWYHSKILNKTPTVNSKKCEIIQWLTELDIAHDCSYTKFELLNLANAHKDKLVYEIDQIACDAGHEVLRLPAYYYHFNPMERIWAQVKKEVRKSISNTEDHTFERLYKMIKCAIDRITTEDWRKSLRHMRHMEEKFRIKERAFEKLIENIVISQDVDSSESDNDE
ncbi:uncharacterized protein [Penaeus vannamei]|uniref:uncharacterized protein n=1 Tax=Penaeus vannamei TaxID=6689 RepID=UPI00387F5403